jgi:acyl-CoA dehydrogenase
MMDGAGTAELILDQASRLFEAQAQREVLARADAGEWPRALWDAIDEAGFPLAFVSEDAGGIGLGAPEVLQVVRRAAFHPVPLPLAETILANALWAEVSGGAVSGVLTIAPCNPTDRVTLQRRGDRVALGGQARRVPWGAMAGYLLVFARDADGLGWLALVPGGQASTARRNIANEPRDTVRFDGVTLPAGSAYPAPNRLQADGVLALGAALRVQQMIGGMDRAMEYALRYANERVQFGRPISKFQAIQHMLAIAAGQLAAATATADAILECFDGDPDRFAFWVMVAKARAGEAAGLVAAAAHQVHAAMGFTQEHPLHYVTRRLWSWREEFGAEAFWQQRLGEAACRAGGEALWPMLSAV